MYRVRVFIRARRIGLSYQGFELLPDLGFGGIFWKVSFANLFTRSK